jgi:SulP family sulfate permease
MFRPKLFDTLKDYSRTQFGKDLLAGSIVGIVALPLAIAFAIASGVTPQAGLYTAIIAGFIISALGGSRVQIGGPTGAFIVVVYGIVQTYGLNGLITATCMAGVMLILMGFARLGSIIKFIPYPLIVGFTSAIALLIAASQVKDFLGLPLQVVPSDFIDKIRAYVHSGGINGYAVLIASVTVAIILLWPGARYKLPGSLIALLVTTAAVQLFHLPVETIGSKFGTIPSMLPTPELPDFSFATIRHLMQPAFTIAMLGGIESLLSAVVADGMIGGRHRSDTELIAQGIANVASSIFGGIPATGAIARTATNIKNGGRTPIAGLVHAIVLLLIMLCMGPWAAMIPMPALAGVLVVVAYTMSEWRTFISVMKGPKGDTLVLLVTFFLTVFFDLTVAIEIGLVLAVFLFMREMIKFSNARLLLSESPLRKEPGESFDRDTVPEGVEVFEIAGPLFFGAAYKFKDALRYIEKPPRVLIIRMRSVPFIDATGIQAMKEVCKDSKGRGIKIILSEVQSTQVMQALKSSRLLFAIGKANVVVSMEKAIARGKLFLIFPAVIV